jgi:hypothetical protein
MHEYNEVEAVRSTEIIMLAQGFTPAHVKAHRKDPPEATAAMILGTVVHGLISGQTQDFGVLTLDGRTKDGKAEKKAMIEANPNAALVKAPEFEQAQKMAESIMKNKQARDLIETGVLEGSFFWREFGARFKSRPDVVSDDTGTIADIKTAREAHWDGFVKAVKYGNYDLQAYQQVHGANEATDRKIEHFLWIVVEKEPPYPTVVYPFNMTSRTAATWEVHAQRLAIAQAADVWPGYDNVGHEINEDLLY